MSKRHKYADQIIFWANNAGSDVYFRERNKKDWIPANRPIRLNWLDEYEYVVVPPRYQHLWEAYLEGKLELHHNPEWVLVKGIPEFHRYSSKHFRVKPYPEVAIIVRVDSVETDLKDISKETLLKAWEAAQESSNND